MRCTRFLKALLLSTLLVSIPVHAETPASFAPLAGWTFEDISRGTAENRPGLALSGATISYSSPAVAAIGTAMMVIIMSEDRINLKMLHNKNVRRHPVSVTNHAVI